MTAYNLFTEVSLMISLGVIVYLVSVAVSRVPEPSAIEVVKTADKKRLGAFLPLDEIDLKLRALKDKALRRLKVIIMKFDNFISKRLNNGGGKM